MSVVLVSFGFFLSRISALVIGGPKVLGVPMNSGRVKGTTPVCGVFVIANALGVGCGCRTNEISSCVCWMISRPFGSKGSSSLKEQS